MRFTTQTEGARFLKVGGRFHVMFLSAEEGETAVEVEAEILAGTVPKQEKKTVKIFLNYPDESHSDGGGFASEIIQHFCKATGLMAADTPVGTDVEIDFSQAVGRQAIVAILAPDADSKYARLNGSDIWPVDAAEVEDVPKNKGAIALLNQSPATQEATQQQPATQAEQSGYDDL